MNYTDSLTIKGAQTNLTLPNRVFLAPMAGVSDLPFRILCHEQGAGLVCMEMVSAKAITYRNRGTANLLETCPGEHPVSLQLFTHEPDVLAAALDMIEDGRAAELADTVGGRRTARHSAGDDHDSAAVPAAESIEPSESAAQLRSRYFDYDILDINMGCPVPKIVNNGEGSALMKDPKRIEQLVSAAVEHTGKPVTVKIRLGFDEQHRNAVDCALAAQAGGASAVAVHGRTRPQMYSGRADLTGIAAVKQAVKIPVFGNGDIIDGPSALRMFEETGCDAVMIGRAAQGNPWIFREVTDYLKDAAAAEIRNQGIRAATDENGAAGEGTGVTRYSSRGAEKAVAPNAAAAGVTPQELKAMILRHTDLMLQYKSPVIAMREMRKHVAWYIQGIPGASKIRNEVMQVNTKEELVALLDKYIK